MENIRASDDMRLSSCSRGKGEIVVDTNFTNIASLSTNNFTTRAAQIAEIKILEPSSKTKRALKPSTKSNTARDLKIFAMMSEMFVQKTLSAICTEGMWKTLWICTEGVMHKENKEIASRNKTANAFLTNSLREDFHQNVKPIPKINQRQPSMNIAFKNY